MDCPQCGMPDMNLQVGCVFCLRKEKLQAVLEENKATRFSRIKRLGEERTLYDIDVWALGVGFLTLILGYVALIAAVVIYLYFGSLEKTSERIQIIKPALESFGFAFSFALHILVGFLTARKAIHAKMLHGLIVAALFMILCVGTLLFFPQSQPSPWSYASWLLILPLILYGTSLANDD